MKNPLIQKLGIRYPVIQAGMAGEIATPELAAAVSEAGGLGTLGAGYWNPEQLEQAVVEVRERTNRPFAVNLFVTESTDSNEEEWKEAKKRLAEIRRKRNLPSPFSLEPMADGRECWSVARETRVPVVSFTFGRPEPSDVKALQAVGTVVMGTATTVAEAVELAEIGVEVVVQGWEAGGHRGGFHQPDAMDGVGLMALLPQVADRVDIPLIAAGGIMDGRGMVAALALGASAVQLGTAFLTSMESGAHQEYRRRVLQSDEKSTRLTRAITGKPARGIRNALMEAVESYGPWPPYPLQHHGTQDIRRAAQQAGDAEWMSLWAGQASGMSREETAGMLVRRIVQEAEAVIDSLAETEQWLRK